MIERLRISQAAEAVLPGSPELGKILLLKSKTTTSLRQFLSFRQKSQEVQPCKVESLPSFREVNIVGGEKANGRHVNLGKQRVTDKLMTDNPT